VHDRCVDSKQIESTVLWASPFARSNDDRIRVHHLFDRSGSDRRRWIERSPVGEIHRLAFGKAGLGIIEQQFRSDSGVQNRRGNT